MRTTRNRATGAGLLVPVLALVLALAGCSGDDEDPADGGAGSGESVTAEIATDAELGSVKGRLSDAAAADVLAAVTEVVDGWFDAAYGGDYPRSDFDAAFGDFTSDAKALALKQSAILSNADLGADLDGVEMDQRLIRVDVLAPKGKVAGATVRFRLGIAMSGGVDRTDQIAGRLMLTPVKGDWKVFGFDVRRGEGGA